MPEIIFTDTQIESFIQEPKSPNSDISTLQTRMKYKQGHKENQLELQGQKGSRFTLILRQSEHNQLDFSVILGCLIPGTNKVFRLRRYNGNGHVHSNKIEKTRIIYKFHIHYATERYQMRGFFEDGYAEATTKYATLTQAIQVAKLECGVIYQGDTATLESFFGPDKHEGNL